MLRENTYVCHRSSEAHWLTPDPAWSTYSHGIGVCIRDEDFSAKPAQPFVDAVAGAASRLVDRVRIARHAGA